MKHYFFTYYMLDKSKRNINSLCIKKFPKKSQWPTGNNDTGLWNNRTKLNQKKTFWFRNSETWKHSDFVFENMTEMASHLLHNISDN